MTFLLDLFFKYMLQFYENRKKHTYIRNDNFLLIYEVLMDNVYQK